MSARVSASAVAVSAMRGTLDIALVQHRQRAVLRAEVMPPLAHAMRFVNCKQRQLAAFVQPVELREKARRRHALRRRVEQCDLAAQQAALDILRLFPIQRGVEKGRRHARLVQRTHLVVHQRDQRRHHHRHAAARTLPRNRGNLVAQRLAAAGGHQHQRVASAGDVLDDGVLMAAELGIAEDLAKDLRQLGFGRWGWQNGHGFDTDGVNDFRRGLTGTALGTEN